MHHVCPEKTRLCENLPILFYQEPDSQFIILQPADHFQRYTLGREARLHFRK